MLRPLQYLLSVVLSIQLCKNDPEVKKYRAHDENNTFKVGDAVRIMECAPKSKTKRWEVLET